MTEERNKARHPEGGKNADRGHDAVDTCREDREECLEALYRLEREGQKVGMSTLLRQPDLQDRPVADVVMELALDGEVEFAGDSISLTAKGREAGRRMYARHQLAERLLRSLGLREGTVHEEACRLEHLLDDDASSAMSRRLDRFETMLGRGVIRLRDAEPGEYRIVFHSAGRFQKQRLDDMGLGQGARVRVSRRQPRGPVEVEAHGARVALGRGVATKVLVTPYVECEAPADTSAEPDK